MYKSFPADLCLENICRDVAQFGLARSVRDAEAGGSNPPIPTRSILYRKITGCSAKRGTWWIHVPGFEKTDEAKRKESAALQRAKRDERPNPPIPTRSILYRKITGCSAKWGTLLHIEIYTHKGILL
jgi:hypothetical protein